MSDPNETLQTLAAQMQQLRDTMTHEQEQLRDTIAQQQAQLRALQARLKTERTADPEEDPAGQAPAAPEPRGRPAKTSRRRLLTTAGAAAAAATAATAAVALGQGQVAYAATGSNLVLGQGNDAGATTSLGATLFTAPNPLLVVDNTLSDGLVGIQGGGVGTFSVGVHGITDYGRGVWGDASLSGIGVFGNSNRWYGVQGTSSASDAVHGETSSGYGVYGQSSSNDGVHGESTGNSGVAGHSTNGVGGWFSGGRAQIQLQPAGAAGAPTTGQHFGGDLFMDSTATLWLCIADGIPGTWARLTRVANGTTGGTVNYLPAPVRLLDARSGASSGLVNRGPLAANEIYALSVAGLGGSGIPAGALGLICNVTVLGPTQNGNLSLFPAGAPIPTTASMTFVAGAFLANHVSAALGGGKVNIQNQSGGNTPLVVDAVGFIM